MAQKIFSEYFYNKISYFGAALSLVMFVVEGILFVMDFLTPSTNSYLSLFTYVVLPPILIIGLLLIPLGALKKKRDVRLGRISDDRETFTFDLANATHRHAAAAFIVITVIFMVMTAVGSYKAFNYTESVPFCGTTCHNIMKPEYTAYLKSPHARVKCVECHIGAGAGWYVRSKLSGARQVVKTLLNDYARPIPVPVHDLRPAKDTCEECHWPGKSFGAIELERSYFPGEPGAIPRWDVRMLMHVSGKEGENRGIHAHMNSDHVIYYAADDEKRQQISWVKSVNKKGEAVVYMTKEAAKKQFTPSPANIRRMDCIDCHSRPSHHYEAPMPLVNRAMAEGKISPAIPLIKARAVEVLAAKYASEEEAVARIRAVLSAYYKEKQAEYYAAHRNEVDDAIAYVAELFKSNIFPEMKVRWDVYPDNIGHMISPGCFRCHDGEHNASSGQTITRDCNVCHAIIAQGPADNMEKSVDGLPFRHPFDGDESWKQMNCADCHSGS